MKFKDLDPLLHNELRLKIMAALDSLDDADFVYLRELTKSTAGNLSVQISKLEEVGVKAIKDAVEQCDIIVIDEVGKMEVESEAFVEAVKQSLEADKPMILTLHKKSRNPLLQDIRRRDDVRILEVTPTNRNILPYKIVRLMNGENV